MDPKRLVIGSVVGMIMLNLMGFLLWEVTLGDYMRSHSAGFVGLEREMPIVWALLLGTLLWGALLTMILDWTGSASTAAGARTAAMAGVLLVGGIDFIYFAFYDGMDLVGVVADVCLSALQFAVTGALIALAVAKLGGSPAAG